MTQDKLVHVINTMENDMRRLKAYFPYRIVYGAINMETMEMVTCANLTRRQMNSYSRKGLTIYQFE